MKKLIWIMLLVLFFGVKECSALTQNRYPNINDQTVNTVTGKVLNQEYGSTSGILYFSDPTSPTQTPYYSVDVYVLHADGSTTTLGTGVAVAAGNTFGMNYGTWDCPETSLASTDALEIVWHVYNALGSAQLVSVTEQLGITKLNASTWSVGYYVSVSYYSPGSTYRYYLRYGTSTYATGITNIGYSVSAETFSAMFQVLN
jgi:hypothetical protein